jgi:hypothetical protein
VKHSLAGFVATLIVVLCVLIPVTLINQSQDSASATAQQGCVVDITGIVGVVVCGGEVVDQINLPTVNITETRLLPPPPQATVTVPGPTATNNVPGPTKTITVFLEGPTKTVTVREREEIIVPVEKTKTVTATPSRQPDISDGTVAPSPEPEPEDNTLVAGDSYEQGPVTKLLDRIDTPAEIAGLSTLTLLILIGLLLLGMYGGYSFGYRDSDRENANFMQALRDQMLIRSKKDR